MKIYEIGAVCVKLCVGLLLLLDFLLFKGFVLMKNC